MADEFKIVASLNIPESASRINKDIPKLEGQAKHLKIVADLNPTLSIKNIQATLNKMNNNANIKIGIDTSGLNSTLSDVQNKVIATNKGLSIKPTVDGKVIEDTDVLIKTIVSKLQTLNTVDLKTFKDNLKNILGVSSKEVAADAETLIQALKLSPEDTNLIINSYQNLIDSIRNALSGMGKDGIVSGNNFDNNVVMSIFQAATKVEEKTKDLGKTATHSAKETQTAVKDTTQVIDKETQAVKVQTDAYDNLALARRTATTDANNNQISRTETYSNSATGKSKTVVYDASDNEQVIKYAENINKVTMAQERANASAIKLEASYAKIKSRIEDVNVAKPIKDTDNITNLKKQYDIVEQAIEAVRNADSTTMASMKANAEKEISALQNLERQYRNAEYVATELRNKDFDTVKTDQINNLNEFIAQVNSSKVPIDTMTKDIDELKTALNGIGDKDSLTKFLNQFDNAKSKFESVKATYQSIADKIKELQRIQNSGTFNKNSSDSTVINLKQQITALLADYEKLKTQLNGNVTPQGLTDIGNKLTQLNTQFNDATNTAKRFETELRNDNSAEQLAQKVKLLNERIKAYQSANPKAAKAFSQEFSDMSKTLSNPNIDLSSYNSVAKQLQIIKVRANEANLAGKTMWATFKEKLAKFTGWMSMTASVSMFTRSIRDALDELKEVDTVLTEISKANDKLTNSQLAQIASSSFRISSKYGKTATDYLVGVQEMSRAGYANAESMGELSTAAQGAGDMTADVANQFIIAADKAYKMNGSVEELTKTLDGINYITNNNAVNMSELSEGFSIVSSTAAASGVSAKELTAALGTMAATTQQSGSEVARAFRAILLNIRQVSDEEEGIDAEGLTKYEKACNDLGVSLKEVKDGVLQLRDPMQVLKELSIEYNKLSETDLKRTNLLNSVGGKSLPRCIEICN